MSDGCGARDLLACLLLGCLLLAPITSIVCRALHVAELQHCGFILVLLLPPPLSLLGRVGFSLHQS
jgi:hypothetical protein